MRKIIQITSAMSPPGSRLIMHALCDDGTVWYRDPWRGYNEWVPLDHDIPQGPPQLKKLRENPPV